LPNEATEAGVVDSVSDALPISYMPRQRPDDGVGTSKGLLELMTDMGERTRAAVFYTTPATSIVQSDPDARLAPPTKQRRKVRIRVTRVDATPPRIRFNPRSEWEYDAEG